MDKIIFVCTGNTCRSPMAEAILKQYNKVDTITSRGIGAYDNMPASQNAVKALEDIGIDIKNHLSKQLTQNETEEANIILCMCESHKKAILNAGYNIKGKIFTLYEYASNVNKDIKDPYGGSLNEYIMCRDEIKALIKAII